MINFIVGVPGSGKTALAVDYLIENGHKNRYEHIYNNINEFNNSLIPNCESLEWDTFYQNINELYVLYHNKTVDPITKKKVRISDEVLIEKAKELRLYKSLIVIDEAHNYFDKRDLCLIWWLSYHRHLSQDIFLITQNLSLVDSKYKAFAEIFYKAVPSLLRLFPNELKYRCHSSSRLTKSDRYATKKINTKTNNIFKYYKSGNNHKTNPIILKFIFAFLIVLTFFFFAVNKIYSSNNKQVQKLNSNQIIQTKEIQLPKPKKIYPLNEYIEDLTDEYLLINFYCVSEICYVNDKKFPYSELQKLINSTDSFLLKYYKKHKLNIYDGYILSSMKLQKILGVKQDEKAFSTMPIAYN